MANAPEERLTPTYGLDAQPDRQTQGVDSVQNGR